MGYQVLTGIYEEVDDELHRARKLFPEQDVWHTLAALGEEVGELNQAILQNKPKAEIRAEGVQVAVMALRVILDTEVAE